MDNLGRSAALFSSDKKIKDPLSIEDEHMPVVFAMSPESSKPSAKPNLSANKPLEGQALVASILAKQSTYKKTQS